MGRWRSAGTRLKQGYVWMMKDAGVLKVRVKKEKVSGS